MKVTKDMVLNQISPVYQKRKNKTFFWIRPGNRYERNENINASVEKQNAMHCSYFIELDVTLFKWFNYNLNMYESDVRVRARYTLELNNDDSFAITLWVVCIYLENEIQLYFEMKWIRNTSHEYETHWEHFIHLS